MRLTSAKCPNCGADIKVNKDEEKTVCEYCKSEILVEDTIAKLKVVVEGEVEHRVIDKYSALIHVNTDKEGGLLDVRAGNFKTEIYQDNSQLQQLTKK